MQNKPVRGPRNGLIRNTTLASTPLPVSYRLKIRGQGNGNNEQTENLGLDGL
jgi:hypothetical protein